MTSCRICLQAAVDRVLDLGPQPISHRYLPDPVAPEDRYALSLGVCGRCGVVQLEAPPPAEALKPRFSWISYHEPEGHLDALADLLRRLPGITETSSAAGITSKDDTLLRRLRERGLRATWRLDAAEDLGIRETWVGPETIQARLTPETAGEVAGRRGACDLLVARHVVEHAHNPTRFLQALRYLLKPGGYLVLEVPDCDRALQKRDYTMIWEEHVAYFTPRTFPKALATWGISLERWEVYPYPLENSLVAVGRFGPTGRAPEDSIAGEVERARAYGAEFKLRRKQRHDFLSGFRRKRGPIALLGAGHLGCAFVNFLGLSDTLECFVDDHPAKQGLFMPGSRLPILGSSVLLEKGIRLCLMSVNPEREAAVIRNHRRYLEAGGVFRSIFPDSPHAADFDYDSMK